MKLAIHTSILIGLIVSLETLCFAQSSRPYRKLITHQMQQQLEDSLPKVVEKRRQIETFTDSVRGSLSLDSITIPIVFHIFYTSPENYVSEAQVRSQIRALNRDFRKEKYRMIHKADSLEGFSQRVANSQVRFCLGTYNLNGRSVSPIHYVSTTDTSWGADHRLKNPAYGGVRPWNPNHLINVWVAPLTNRISGFAQMPGGPPETDGIVIDYRFFGTIGTAVEPYTEGKTLTHLVGNYLNLYDLWGGGNDCVDDGVEDTPIHNDANYTCPPYKHVSVCEGNPVEMTMNFMDNTDDPCMYMFTKGQRARMRAVLTRGGPREGLVLGRASICDPLSHNRFLDPSTALNDPDELINSIYLFPNPASDEVNILINSQDPGSVELEVYNSLGSVIARKQISLQSETEEYTLSLENWAAGVYYVYATINDISTTHQLIVR